MEKQTKQTLSQAESDCAVNLEKAIMGLIDSDPFYAEMLLGMRRIITTKLPTAGVNVTDEVNLYLNPYFFNNLHKQGRVAVLKHEALHCLHNHFERFLDLDPKKGDETKSNEQRIKDMVNASLHNRAADYAINEYIPNLPEKVNFFDAQGNMVGYPKEAEKKGPALFDLLFVRKLKKEMPKVEERQTTEYYYELLKEEHQKNQDDCKTCDGKGTVEAEVEMQGPDGKPQKVKGTAACPDCSGQGAVILDDHSIWYEGEQNPDIIKEKVKEVVNKAAENCNERHAGNMPSEVLEAIDKLNHVPKDWRQDVQRFVARSMEILVEPTRKRRNRRFGTLYAGQKTDPKLHIATVFDSSGSIRSEELSQFFAEMARLHKMGIKLTVIECDSQVQAVYDFDPKRKPEIKGRGGTAFVPAFEEANKHEIDGLIYFTDGENWDVDETKKPKYPVLWALLKGCKSRYTWGASTTVEVKKRVYR
jgi:predicted metal-dependent peptidase